MILPSAYYSSIACLHQSPLRLSPAHSASITHNSLNKASSKRQEKYAGMKDPSLMFSLWGCVSGCQGKVEKCSFRVMLHFNRNNKLLIKYYFVSHILLCAATALGTFFWGGGQTWKSHLGENLMPKNKECRAPGGEIYLTYILSPQRLISRKKRSNQTWNGPVYHSYIWRRHFIHQSLLWCLISLVTLGRPTPQIIKDWWGVLVKDRGGEMTG